MKKILFLFLLTAALVFAETYEYSDSGGGGISSIPDSINVDQMTVDSLATIENLTATTGIIEAVGSQNILNFKPDPTAVDGDIVNWKFIINDTMDVMIFGGVVNAEGGLYPDSTTVWITTQPHVSAYVETAGITTITTAGTYQFLEAGFINKSAKGFTADSTGITALIRKSRVFESDGAFTVAADANNTTVTIALQLYDGTTTSIIPGSEMSVRCETANYPYPLPIGTTTWLEYGDKITIVITTDGTGDQVTVSEGHIKIKPL